MRSFPVKYIALIIAFYSTINIPVFTQEGNMFLPKTDYTAGDSPCSVFLADLDSDDDLDLVVANYNSDNISVLLNIGSTNDIIIPAGEVCFLSQNHPNPFSGETLIQYQIPEYGFM